MPHREQTWVVERDEDAPFTPPTWLKVERVPRGKTKVSMLLDGELPAVMTPQTPKPILDGDKRIARLFPDYVERVNYGSTGALDLRRDVAPVGEIVMGPVEGGIRRAQGREAALQSRIG